MILGCVAGPAMAKSDSGRNELTIDGYTISEMRALQANCGDYRQVGVSSIFGSPEDYMNPYPELGWLSAKLDRVNSIPGHIRAQFNDKFQKSHETQYNLYYAMAQMEYRFDMTKNILDGHEASLRYNTEKMRESAEESRRYIEYNTQKTISETTELLQSPKNGYIPEDAQSYEDNGWDDYQACMQWWEYQESHPSGRYLQYL